MTDKQIIIDGVDVSGCKNLMQGIVPFGCMEDRKTCSCMNNPNCLYKQLKHKEQEYERLSSLIRKTQTYKDTCCDCRDDILLYPSISGRTNYTQIEVEERSLERIIQQLDQLKVELEQYKKSKQASYEALQKKCNELELENRRLKAENEELKKCYKNNSALLDFEETNTTKLVNKVMKLEQTLTEIKDITEENMRIADLEGLNGVYRRGLAKQILNKISEVIENE